MHSRAPTGFRRVRILRVASSLRSSFDGPPLLSAQRGWCWSVRRRRVSRRRSRETLFLEGRTQSLDFRPSAGDLGLGPGEVTAQLLGTSHGPSSFGFSPLPRSRRNLQLPA